MKKFLIISIIIFSALILWYYIDKKIEEEKLPKDRKVITFWYAWGGSAGRAVNAVVNRFNNEQKDVYVTAVQVPKIEQKLLTVIAANVAPDVAVMDRFRIASWAARNSLTKLNDKLNQYKINSKIFFKSCWKEVNYNQGVWGVPINTDVRILFYNKTIFKEVGLDPNRPPRNWDELKVYAEKLTIRDKDGKILRVGFVPIWGNAFLHLYAWQKGGKFLSEDGKFPYLDSKPIISALEWMVKFADQFGMGHLLTFSSGFGRKEQDPFLTGKIVMSVEGNWFINTIRKYAPNLKYGVAIPPPPKDGIPATWSGGHALVIPRGSNKIDATIKFIKFFTSVKGQLIFAKESMQIPANKQAAETADFIKKSPKWQLCLKAMKIAKYRDVTPLASIMWDSIFRAMDKAIHHKSTPKQALKEANQSVKKSIDEFYRRNVYSKKIPFSFFIIVVGLLFLLLIGYIIKKEKVWKMNKLEKKEALNGYLFALPWFLGFFIFILGPMIMSIIYSFSNYQILTPARWIGFANFKKLFTGDPLFWKSLSNTAYYVGLRVPLHIILALLIALLLNKKVIGVRIFRTIFYLPSILTSVAVAVLWMWIFNPDYGLLNAFLKIFIKNPPLWLQSPVWAKPALIIMSIWNIGGSMIIFLAGLQNIPEELYEAAEIDGASNRQSFFKITLPLLTPTIFFNLIMTIIGSFQVFTFAFVMTNGGPIDSTLFYVLYLYKKAFMQFEMGYSSALAWVLFVIILSFTLVQVHFSKKWVYYK